MLFYYLVVICNIIISVIFRQRLQTLSGTEKTGNELKERIDSVKLGDLLEIAGNPIIGSHVTNNTKYSLCLLKTRNLREWNVV